MDPTTVSRREALLGLSALGVALMAGCGPSNDDGSTASPSPTDPPSPADPPSSADLTPSDLSCVRTPEQMEGPFYLDRDMLRQDIRDGRPGVPLELEVRVVDADGCLPLADVAVDVWHCDALGAYSGFEGLEGETFLRGTQVTDGDGRCTFTTIVPGWYDGRAVHIHLKAHPTATTQVTTQLYFDDGTLDGILADDPYARRAGRRVRNDEDGIFRSSDGPAPIPLVATEGGRTASFVLGIAIPD